MHPELIRQIAVMHVQDMQSDAAVARRARLARRARRGHSALPPAGSLPPQRPGLVLRSA